tara:strand:+ start:342 stop:1421 length:1080 start_codon:yes stop_codon:yes gene_type:complete
MVLKSYKNKKNIFVLTTFLILLASGIAVRIGSSQNKSRDLSPFTISAQKGTLPGLITASGELRSEKSVNISPKRQGILQDIFVDEGDYVEKDDLIAKMDEGDLIYRLNELKAEFEKQKGDYDRRKDLYIEGAISQEDLEQYKNLFLKSQARLKQREVEQSELEIRAPFQGIITNRLAVPGAFVTPTTTGSASNSGSSTKASIVELSQGLEVIAKVPESDIGRIQVNQNAQVRVDAFPDQRFEAKVNEISPRAIKSNNVTSFEVILLLINPPKKLRIGMTADIEFQTGESEVNTLVPTVAIVTRNGEPGVLIVGKGNQPEYKKVQLGISSGSKTVIIKGINVGDEVFIDLPPWSKQTQNQ